jgi:hypothetical protein
MVLENAQTLNDTVAGQPSLTPPVGKNSADGDDDEESHSFASLKIRIEQQLNAHLRSPAEKLHQPLQKRSSASVLEKYATMKPQFLLANEDLVVHDVTAPERRRSVPVCTSTPGNYDKRGHA